MQCLADSGDPLGDAMPLKSADYGLHDVEIEKQDTVFDGFFKMREYTIKHRLFSGEWSGSMTREIFGRGPAAAAVLYDPNQDAVGLVEQFRIGALSAELGPWCLEVVAGMVEEGENPEQLIRRELVEEAGIDSAELIPISRYYSTPGGCDEVIDLYCALCDLSNKAGIYGLDSENEDIRLHVLSAETVFTDMYNGRTNNAATLIGLQWLQLNRSELLKRMSLSEKNF